MKRSEALRDRTHRDGEPAIAAGTHEAEEPLRDEAWNESGRDAVVSQAQPSSNLVVDIYDQMYHLRGPDPKYLEKLSALVDAKMRAVAQEGTTVDSLRVAVLAALNIADELVTLQQQREALAGNMVHNIRSRTEVLAEMLDAALDANRKAG